MTPEKHDQDFDPFNYENAFNAISDFITVLGRDYKIIQANHNVCQFLGKPVEELIGADCFKVFHARNEKGENCPHSQAVQFKSPAAESADDNRMGIPLLVKCSPVFNPEGITVGSVHIARDLSAQRSVKKRRSPPKFSSRDVGGKINKGNLADLFQMQKKKG